MYRRVCSCATAAAFNCLCDAGWRHRTVLFKIPIQFRGFNFQGQGGHVVAMKAKFAHIGISHFRSRLPNSTGRRRSLVGYVNFRIFHFDELVKFAVLPRSGDTMHQSSWNLVNYYGV